ncbi:hypothetical protein LTR10_020269 [Elasticomyces elasticus]|uniref:Xylanolytic transcriptional activator regulatory domain-containing protein n=1 Tax=Exophiala sideris TaxID=1016849 RepID=A0ABR0IVS7_9EURO|nr:hypothetical protein LTR10_020269 [Elasticomyces elasticus]KAK5021289.1 hypothetical protein LTS07_011128 [Exophiala sideris]KAK5024240.1 hypothetical protein LTR13_010949 [Exophiala sideris]KAK5049182.1 hypothetical protein LTR69_011146 [Exophiala sideris]KAK5176493.1 hypothetical protein LTR44_010971 [Eurotiomycetes sp. CCFEE 6388]
MSKGHDDHPFMTPAQSAMSTEGDNGMKKRKTSSARQDLSATPKSHAAPETSAPPAQLKAIEEQLLRLTTLVDTLRQSGSDDPRLWDILTPSHSDQDSDEAAPRRSFSLDMFQNKKQGPPRDVNELSRPLSNLKLSGNNGEPRADPFWVHITEELNQLNYMMKRRNHTYASSTSIQNQACDTPYALVPPPKDASAPERDDFRDPSSFHKAAGVGGIHNNTVETDCPVCQTIPFTKTTLLSDIPLRSSNATARQHLFKDFPSRIQSNVLFRCWLSNIYPVLPILIPSDIFTKHESLWDQVETGRIFETEQLDPEFFALIYAIWYSGSLSLSAQGLHRWFPGTSRASLASRFHNQVVFSLHLGSVTRNATLQKLAALILIQSIPVAEEDPMQASLYMQLTTRLALTMGLHREPTLFGLSVAEEGMRRRLWWQLIQLDTSLVVASGYPSLISEAFCDTRINCEDSDAYVPDNDSSVDSGKLRKMPAKYSWGEPNLNPTDENGNLTSYRTMGLVARAKSIMACALRTVVSMHLGTKMLTNRDMQENKRIIAEATDQLDDIIKMIPAKGLPELGFVPDAPSRSVTNDCDTAMSSPVTQNELAYYKTYVSEAELVSPLARYHKQKLAAFNKWARISLSMMKDKLHIVAYAPFLKNAKSKLWTLGRQCALHHCHAFMRKFLSLAEDPDLETMRWCWPASYGPMHAALIVLVDLYERPRSVEAPRSREMIDRVFVLSSPGAGIVGGTNGVSVQRPLREGGVEAWDMLRGLRSAAWQKAGLDPTVLWTEADQIAVGAATPLTDEQKIAQMIREDKIPENDRGSNKDGGAAVKSHPSDDAVLYMVKLGLSEVWKPGSGSDSTGAQQEGDGLPCSRTSGNEVLTEIENGERFNLDRGLAKRDGQITMPFPLSGALEKCSRHVANGGGLPAHVLHNGSTSLGPTGGSLQACPSQMEAMAAQGSVRAQTNGNVNGHGAGHDQYVPYQVETAPQGAQEQSHTNGGVNGTGPNRAYGNGSGEHHETSFDNGNGIDTGVRDGPTGPSQDLGFDWERWDSVFGQYSGFTDMMEDITWADDGAT